MAINTEVDLTEFEWPICLLEFNKILDKIRRGSVLEVVVRDPDIVQVMEMIVDNSPNRIAAIQKEINRFRISIRKG